MIRQRINLRTPALAYLVRLLTVLLALALFWYGLMIVLLAVKVSAHTVNELSAYRTLYHDAATVTASDFSTAGRLIAGFAGLLVFLVGSIWRGRRSLARTWPAASSGSVTANAVTPRSHPAPWSASLRSPPALTGT